MTEKECREKTDKPDQEAPARPEDVFAVEEIEIEEVAIDGICGVY
ncbi:MAG: mycofactocin precursor MftA [Thermodesulfobacteriota bacterium]